MLEDMTPKEYDDIRLKAFDEYVREQDAESERGHLAALYQQGVFHFDD